MTERPHDTTQGTSHGTLHSTTHGTMHGTMHGTTHGTKHGTTPTTLVTGATGFTGWHAAARLRAAGRRVRVLVRDVEKARRLLAPLGIAENDMVVGSMTDPAAVERALEGCDAALHAAATVAVATPGAESVFDDNVKGTELVVGGACQRGLASVVFVSSLTAIFDPRADRVHADSPLVQSESRYGRSKADSDAFVRSLQDAGARVSIVYPSAIVGPDDPGRSESMKAHRIFLRLMIETEGGVQFVDVRDLAALLERVLDYTGEQGGARFVAAGHFSPWPLHVRRIRALTGARMQSLRAPGWALRSLASAVDVVSRVSGRSFPMTREGLEIATRWRAVSDSPGVEELGIVWRDPDETLEDAYRWMLSAGHLPAAAVPALAEAKHEGPAAGG